MTLLDELRELTNEPTEATYTDAKMLEILAENGNDVDLAASDVWTRKAGKLADLVDTSESGSNRKLGDLYKQALEMASFYAKRSVTGDEFASRGTRIRSITRA